jgi:hypothetical protein
MPRSLPSFAACSDGIRGQEQRARRVSGANGGGNTMTMQRAPTAASRLVQGVAVLNAVLLLTGFILSIRFAALTPVEAWDNSLHIPSAAVGAIVYSALAVLIVSRHPRHTVGWLFLIVSFFCAQVLFLGGLQAMAQELPINAALVRGLIHSAGNVVWVPMYFIPLTLILQFFPDGRLPSRRWWPLTLAATVMIATTFAQDAFTPWSASEVASVGTNNPFAIPAVAAFLAATAGLFEAISMIAVAGSVAAVVVRFFRAQGSERLQMKWLVYTAVVGITAILALGTLGDPESLILNNIFFAFPILLAIAIGIAILRYRLFDIDVIIRRTLQYTLLTGILALVYFGLVVLLQTLFAEVSQESGILTVVSTLVVAALFAPLRRRVQQFIDRRFYRRKYDAEQALAQFATHARDDVDVEKLAASLLEVVATTMQPESVGLWLLHDGGREARTGDS